MSRCPACAVLLASPAEKAAHVCPFALNYDPSGADVEAAAVASRAEAAQRAAIRPTKDALLRDAVQCVRDFIAGWDGEVECVILLAPRGTNDIAFATYAAGTERRLQLLRLTSERVRTTQRKLVPS